MLFSITDSTSLLLQTKSLLDVLDSDFRALVDLHETALREEDDGVVKAISNGVSSLKNKMVSWTNRNRRMWRGGRSGSGSTRPSQSCEEAGGVDTGGTLEEPQVLEHPEGLGGVVLEHPGGSGGEILMQPGGGAEEGSSLNITLGPQEVGEAKHLVAKLMRLLSQ